MDITTTDGSRIVHVGTSDVLHSLYSTALVRLDNVKSFAPLALQFLKKHVCESRDAEETARQLNLVRDALSQIKPEDAVYDYRELEKVAPWTGRISRVVTSCANLYTTADGKDLLFEMVSILTYASLFEVAVEIH